MLKYVSKKESNSFTAGSKVSKTKDKRSQMKSA